MTGAKVRQLDHVVMEWDRETGLTVFTITDENGVSFTYTAERQQHVMLKVQAPDPYDMTFGPLKVAYAPPPTITITTSPNPIVDRGLEF